MDDPHDPHDPHAAHAAHDEPGGATPDDAALTPAERLRARAAATDRAARFDHRLAQVEAVRARRRRIRQLVRVGWVVLIGALGALAPLVVAAVTGGPDPSGSDLLAGAGVGAVAGWLGPVVRNALARRRGAQAWDAYHERYVLFGDPSGRVRDADRPGATRGGPPPPAERR